MSKLYLVYIDYSSSEVSDVVDVDTKDLWPKGEKTIQGLDPFMPYGDVNEFSSKKEAENFREEMRNRFVSLGL